MRTLAIALLTGGAVLGCASTPPPPRVDEAPDEAPVRCRERMEAGLLAERATERCPWVVVGDGHHVQTGTLDPRPRDWARGPWPEGCPVSACRVDVIETPAGRLLLAEAAGRDSETPEGVWLGVFSGDGALAWIDLWAGAGESDMVDRTRAGPSHGLTALACDGGVRLEVAPRLAGAATVEPPPELSERAGSYAWRDGALVRHDVELTGCQPIGAAGPG